MCNTVHTNVVKVAVSHSASQNGDPDYPNVVNIINIVKTPSYEINNYFIN